ESAHPPVPWFKGRRNQKTVTPPASINHRICSRSSPRDRRYRTTSDATVAAINPSITNASAIRAASKNGTTAAGAKGLGTLRLSALVNSLPSSANERDH